MSHPLIAKIIHHIQHKQDNLAGFDQRLLLQTTEGDYLFIDTHHSPVQISTQKQAADLTLICSRKMLEKLVNGKTSPLLALSLGRIKLRGSLEIAKEFANRLARDTS